MSDVKNPDGAAEPELDPFANLPEFMRPRAGETPPPGIDLSTAITVPDEDEDESATADPTPFWVRALDEIRVADRANAAAIVVLLGREERLIRLVSVWSLLGIPFVAPAPAASLQNLTAPEILSRAWSQIWQPTAKGQEVVPALVSVASGMNLADSIVAARMAVQNRLIYPHGKIHLAAEHFMRTEAIATLVSRTAAVVVKTKK